MIPGLEKLRDKFLTLLPARQQAIATALDGAAQSADAAVAAGNLAEAHRVLHQIAGSAGSFGFEELGDAAAAFEIAILQHLEAQVPAASLNAHAKQEDFARACSAALAQRRPE